MPDPNPHIQAKHVLPILLAGMALSALAALVMGGADLSPGRVFSVLWHAGRDQTSDPAAAQIVMNIRLPRIILALAIGSAMGLAGLSSQTLFRNPLASPYVLGVSNGSAVGAVVAMLLVGRTLGYSAIPLVSLAGGLTVGAVVSAVQV